MIETKVKNTAVTVEVVGNENAPIWAELAEIQAIQFPPEIADDFNEEDAKRIGLALCWRQYVDWLEAAIDNHDELLATGVLPCECIFAAPSAKATLQLIKLADAKLSYAPEELNAKQTADLVAEYARLGAMALSAMGWLDVQVERNRSDRDEREGPATVAA